MAKRLRMTIALLLIWLAAPLAAAELPDFSAVKYPGVARTAIGVTRRGTPIEAFVDELDADPRHSKQRLLLIGGLDGERRSVVAALEALRWFTTHADAEPHRRRMTLAVIPCANPDGVLLDAGESNGSGGQPGEPPPPKDKYYQSPTHVEAQYLARWQAMHAPDFVVEVRVKQPAGRDVACLAIGEGKVADLLAVFLAKHAGGEASKLSAKRQTIIDRVSRDDRDFARLLLEQYRQAPKSGAYFDTLPLLAGRRLAKWGVSVPAPEFALQEQAPRSGSELSGLLYLVDQQQDLSPAARVVVRRAADLAFDRQGKPLAEPPFHNEMSDAVFMNGPLLAGVGALTGETKYFDTCAEQQRFLRSLCRREDGLYRHSPLSESAWGRGNGFVALGMALMLERWPEKHADRQELLAAYQAHMAALKRHQDYTGMWSQVIDHPESYREFTGACMIGFAMARGIRGGWLERDAYQTTVDRAWLAIKARASDKGEFWDVCTGTGKQKSLRDYYDREALSGRDQRGASMALLFASEMARD